MSVRRAVVPALRCRRALRLRPSLGAWLNARGLTTAISVHGMFCRRRIFPPRLRGVRTALAFLGSIMFSPGMKAGMSGDPPPRARRRALARAITVRLLRRCVQMSAMMPVVMTAPSAFSARVAIARPSPPLSPCRPRQPRGRLFAARRKRERASGARSG